MVTFTIFIFFFFADYCLSSSVPAKGWNSWDCFQGGLNESGAISVATNMVKYLLPFGYDTLTIDEFWYPDNCQTSDCLDQYGRAQPDIKKWPSSANGKGLAPFANKIHSMGLKLGIHTLRGSISIAAINAKSKILNGGGASVDQLATTKCPWNKNWYAVNTSHPAASLWFDSVYGQYAEWGVDLIKNDCVFGNNWEKTNIVGVSAAMAKTGRHMTYSLSPGGGDQHQEFTHASQISGITNQYRVTGDWHGGNLDYHFDIAHVMEHLIGVPGFDNSLSFPDLDMLNPYKNAKDDADFRLQMTLWSITRSPLIYGADIRSSSLTAADFSLLTNAEVLKVVDASTANHQVSRSNNTVVWAARGGSGVSYVALMNTGTKPAVVSASYRDVAPISQAKKCMVRDLWLNKDVGVMINEVNVTLPAKNGAALYALSRCTNEINN